MSYLYALVNKTPTVVAHDPAMTVGRAVHAECVEYVACVCPGLAC